MIATPHALSLPPLLVVDNSATATVQPPLPKGACNTCFWFSAATTLAKKNSKIIYFILM